MACWASCSVKGEAFLESQGCYFFSRTVTGRNHRPLSTVLCRIFPGASRERQAKCTTLAALLWNRSPGVQPTMTGRLTPWQWGQYWPPSNACHVFWCKRTWPSWQRLDRPVKAGSILPAPERDSPQFLSPIWAQLWFSSRVKTLFCIETHLLDVMRPWAESIDMSLYFCD